MAYHVEAQTEGGRVFDEADLETPAAAAGWAITKLGERGTGGVAIADSGMVLRANDGGYTVTPGMYVHGYSHVRTAAELADIIARNNPQVQPARVGIRWLHTPASYGAEATLSDGQILQFTAIRGGTNPVLMSMRRAGGSWFNTGPLDTARWGIPDSQADFQRIVQAFVTEVGDQSIGGDVDRFLRDEREGQPEVFTGNGAIRVGGEIKPYAVMSTESRDNLYDIRLYEDGEVERLHNNRLVEKLPRSPLVTELEQAFRHAKNDGTLRGRIEQYRANMPRASQPARSEGPIVYYGVTIDRLGPNSSGMRYSALGPNGYLRADTLDGIKGLIRESGGNTQPQHTRGGSVMDEILGGGVPTDTSIHEMFPPKPGEDIIDAGARVMGEQQARTAAGSLADEADRATEYRPQAVSEPDEPVGVGSRFDLLAAALQGSGIVTDREKALAGPCYDVDLGGGKVATLNEGVMGWLNKEQQDEYCVRREPLDLPKDATDHLRTYIAVAEACSTEPDTMGVLSCVQRELGAHVQR